MEKKIIEYVNYHFHYDKRSDLDEVKKEIVGNLIDRYHDYVSDGYDKEKAYIDTIKYLGEISETIDTNDDELMGKMNWALVAMVTVTALAYCAALLSLFSSFTGLLVALASIVLFATSAYYLYAKSQFEKKEKFDLELQRINMRTIMRYFRINYLAWSVSLTFSITGLVMGVIFLLTSENIATLLIQDELLSFVIGYAVVTFIVFVAVLSVLKLIENRLYVQYKHITGEDVPDVMLRNLFGGVTFLFKVNWYLVFLVFSSIGIMFTSVTYVHSGHWEVSGVYFGFIIDLPLLFVPILFSAGVLIVIIVKKNMTKRGMFLLNVINLLGYMGIGYFYEFYSVHHFSMIFEATVVLSVVLFAVHFMVLGYKKKYHKVLN